MASGLSDHSPILISFPTTHKPKSRFQFCEMWSKHPEFHSIIQKAIPPIHGPASKQLELFLSNLRPRLNQLNKNSYADLHEQKAKAKTTVEAIQQQMIEDRGNSPTAKGKGGQNKIEWIKYGDNCTRLFFAKAKQRKLATYVYATNDEEGLQVEGFENVGQVMLNFYNKLLRKSFTPLTRVDPEIVKTGPVLSLAQQQALTEAFFPLDTQEAIFSIPSTKSPGPDGFNSGFFKSSWNTSGPLVIAAVQEFFKTEKMPRYLSNTKLILIPKTASPQTATDFRPISCCNVVYKCISKLLCSRLKNILPGIISQSQSAFIKQREILYNIMICQDIVRGYHRKHTTPRCILKVDLHKAFDSIHWDFLKEMLIALKFPKRFITWVLSCVTNVDFSIHLNGQISGEFMGGLGLRQGDPLSPLLSTISMEYLSRLLNVICKRSDFKFHPNCKTLELTHLMFADDLILFSKADPTTLKYLKEAPETFHMCAGLKANAHKSHIVFGGCSEELQAQCIDTTGLQEGTFPLNYLGVPISASRLTKTECKPLIEKIMERVQLWTTKRISFARRAQLIKKNLSRQRYFQRRLQATQLEME
ncbi:hypothetical protein Cgig2_027872 [Carnegiea gigantea]|uniref:Reverse transcriptase domain-containing protein n=1 Tax=Carnegiea gigantea TaxID=171969 RepID=A0A9Q1KN48_9CARY|nr:hypothetical protein Cgig2_027872 [Carnegiea gigantea]